MKSYTLSSCFEMDPEELYEDNFVKKDNIDDIYKKKLLNMDCLKYMGGYWP